VAMSQDLFSDSQLFDSQNSETEEVNENELEDQGFSQLSMNEQNMASNGQTNDHLDVSQTNGQNKNKESLVRTDLSEERKRQFNDKYYETYLKTKEVENMSDICKSTAILSEQIDKQNQYFKSGGVNENMPLDAKCILTNSAISLRLVKKLQTDSKQFDSLEFAEKLLTALNPFQRIDRSQDEDEDNDTGIDRNDWIEFGRKFCRFHKLVPTFHFIHGSFDSSSIEAQPKQTRPRAQRQKPILSNVTEATQIDPKSKVNDETTPEEVELILATVKRLEEKNNCALPYVPVIVNPKSISETVENIFHSAFLVKDGMVRIVTDDEDGSPALQSIGNSQVDSTHDDSSAVQSVFSFTMNDWKYWIKKFDIKKAAIRHPNK